METIKLNIVVDKDWLEATWTKEVTTINEVEKDGKLVQEDSVATEQVHCESFSGHREHIQMLRAKAKEFNTSLDEFEDIIKQCQDSFVYPTEEENEVEQIKQFQIQFRFDRDSLLNKTDIEINKSEDLGQDTKALRAYRQALRDATINWVMPESIL